MITKENKNLVASKRNTQFYYPWQFKLLINLMNRWREWEQELEEINRFKATKN